MLGTALYNSGNQFYLDQCTRCSCSNSAVSCVRETCPVHDCPAEHQTVLPGRCCPQCPEVEEVRPSCTYAGKTYGASIFFGSLAIAFVSIPGRSEPRRGIPCNDLKNLFCPRQDGESWKLDSCKACACMQGKVRCAMPMCPQLNLPCPPNSRLEHPEGQCCPRCVESKPTSVPRRSSSSHSSRSFSSCRAGDGVCTVFGDPHYRTFDGKFYSFKGACKYQLASDCSGHTFSVRVTNDARSTRFSAWTKTIAIKVRRTAGPKRRFHPRQR